MVGIDLFAGSGGMTLGAKWAGIDVKYALEYDMHAAATYRYNNDDVTLFEVDIRRMPRINTCRTEELVVFGGPPCQGFSTSNQRNRSAQNPNNWLFREFLRLIKQFKPLPEWIVFENVRGFAEAESGLFLKAIFHEFEQLGYSMRGAILNAQDYGVPQRRSRFFAVGNRVGKAFSFPTPMCDGELISVIEAIEDLPTLLHNEYTSAAPYSSTAYSKFATLMRGTQTICIDNDHTKNNSVVIERFKHVPQGGNWMNIPPQLMDNYRDRNRCHTGIYHRLHPNRPSIVLGNYRKNMLIHPYLHRGLTVREAARLQSFPDWYHFEGSIGFKQQQVGNAVPPLLAKSLFESIII